MAKVSHSSSPLSSSILTYNENEQALGSLAGASPVVNSTLSGPLVSKDFTYTFLSPSDLRDFTGLSTSVIMQRQRIKVAVTWDLVRWHLRGMYGKIEEGLDKDRVPTMRVRYLPDSTMEHTTDSKWRP